MNKQDDIRPEVANFDILVKIRSNFAWFLFAVTFVIYNLLVILVGVAPDILAIKIGDTPLSLGIMLGIIVIVVCVAITGLYTYVANTFLDREFGGAIRRLYKAELIDDKGNLKVDIHYDKIDDMDTEYTPEVEEINQKIKKTKRGAK